MPRQILMSKSSISMLRPTKIHNEKYNFDIAIVVKTRNLDFIGCNHHPPSNLETIENQELKKSTYYYCVVCKDFRIIKDIR